MEKENIDDCKNLAYGQLTYNKSALNEMCETYDVRLRRLMAVNGQTNPIYAKRWLEGGDMRVLNLASICTTLRFDLLQFFLYDGYRFKTSLENLYRAERAGIDINAMLMERGIATYNERAVSHDPTAVRYETRANIDEMVDAAMERYNDEIGNLSVGNILQRISQIRDDSEAEYKRNINTVRKSFESELKHSEATIALLKNEVARLQRELEKKNEKGQ